MQNELIRSANTFENGYRERKQDFDRLRNDYDMVLENLTKTSYKIKNEVIEENQLNYKIVEIPELHFSSIVANSIIKSLDRTVEITQNNKLS